MGTEWEEPFQASSEPYHRLPNHGPLPPPPTSPFVTLIPTQVPLLELPASLSHLLSACHLCFCLYSGIILHDSPVTITHSLPDQCGVH